MSKCWKRFFVRSQPKTSMFATLLQVCHPVFFFYSDLGLLWQHQSPPSSTAPDVASTSKKMRKRVSRQGPSCNRCHQPDNPQDHVLYAINQLSSLTCFDHDMPAAVGSSVAHDKNKGYIKMIGDEWTLQYALLLFVLQPPTACQLLLNRPFSKVCASYIIFTLPDQSAAFLLSPSDAIAAPFVPNCAKVLILLHLLHLIKMWGICATIAPELKLN